MKLVAVRSIALAGAIAAAGLADGSTQATAAPSCLPAPGAYAFGCTGSATDYATLTLQVGKNTVSLSTDGFQGWVSNTSFNIGGPLGANSNYMVGVYDNASYNNYFGFKLSSLASKATVTSATLTVYSGLVNQEVNYTLFGATQWISQLESGFSPNPNLYHDLVTGAVYDDPILPPNANDPTAPPTFTFTLGGSAVADINAAIQDHTMMFAVSGHAELANSVPEASTWILMLAGFAGVGVVALRRAARGRSSVAAR